MDKRVIAVAVIGVALLAPTYRVLGSMKSMQCGRFPAIQKESKDGDCNPVGFLSFVFFCIFSPKNACQAPKPPNPLSPNDIRVAC
jgi:hypothetical protein